MTERLRIGTRGSRLALVQARSVAARLEAAGFAVELVEIVTRGDVRPAGTAPGEGWFVSAIEDALAAGEVDLAVHSAKDVPLEIHPGLEVAAHVERADPRDVVVRPGAPGGGIDALATGTTVGTDSPRRTGFLLHLRPDLRPVPFHGNVDTRLRGVEAGRVGALVLAAAGLDRLGLPPAPGDRLPPRLVTPAPGQGALAVEIRTSDARARVAAAALDQPAIGLAVAAEREVLAATGGTCRSPVGALAVVEGGRLRLLAAAVSIDGAQHHALELEVPAELTAALAAGRQAGAELLARVELAA